jgi:hypothetical protein
LVNGTLQEGNVLRLMESSNEKSDMQKGYEAIEKCKGFGGWFCNEFVIIGDDWLWQNFQ